MLFLVIRVAADCLR